MSIEIVDARASAAAAVRWFGTAAPKPAFSRSRRDRCHPRYFQVDRTGRALPGGWTFLSTRPSRPWYAPAATRAGSTSPRPCSAAPAPNRLPNKGSEQSK
jgi:hypothetical protein